MTSYDPVVILWLKFKKKVIIESYFYNLYISRKSLGHGGYVRRAKMFLLREKNPQVTEGHVIL